jgi:hypothetical protein
MPIAGLSDIIILPRLGKIHRGIKREDGSPKAVRFFVLPGEKEIQEGKISPEVVKALRDRYGKEPTELSIYIPCEDKELWAPQYLKRYSRSRGLTCKGTGGNGPGKVLMRMVDTDTGNFANRNTQEGHWTKIFPDSMDADILKALGESYKRDPATFSICPGKECPEYASGNCKEVMCLQFILPDIPGLGVWQLDTSSVNSIKNINACDYYLKRSQGRISGIPLLLTTEPLETLTPQGRKQTVYVLHIRTRETMNQLLKYMLARVKLLEAGRAPSDQLDIPEAEEVEMPELLFPEHGEVPEEAPAEEPPETDEAPFPVEGATKQAPAATTSSQAPDESKIIDQEPGKESEDDLKKLRQKVATAWANVTGKKVDERKKWMKEVYQTDTMTDLNKDQLNDMYLRIQAMGNGEGKKGAEAPAKMSDAERKKKAQETIDDLNGKAPAAATPAPTPAPPAIEAQAPLSAPAAEVKAPQGRNWKEMTNEQVEAACKELGYSGLPEQTKLRNELHKLLHELGYTTDEEKRKYLTDISPLLTRDMTKDQLNDIIGGVKKALEALKEADKIPDDI